MLSEPYDWWWSGSSWYCKVSRGWGYRIATGAGATKKEAAEDAREEVRRLDAAYCPHRAREGES